MMIAKGEIDKTLAFALGGLILFGLILISSVSVFESFQLTSIFVKKGIADAPSNDFYLWRQAAHVLIAFPLMWFISQIHYGFWKKMALPLFGVSILLLFLVLIPSLSNDYGSAKSWLNIPYLPSIQPSEIAKLALIFYLAIWMDKKVQAITSFKEGFLPFVVLLSVLVALIGAQPDFGAVLVIACIAGSIFFVAGGNILHIIFGGLLASLFAWPVILSNEYIRIRMLAFLDPTIDPQGAGYQIKQALITIGSGEWWGVGFGKSVQKFGYLPEVQGDTIFSVAAEELGFIRILLMFLLYLFIAWRGYKIAMNAPDRFSTLLATGITSWIFFQSMINIGVNMSVLPLTGVTLPFISYGGSSLITLVIAAGVLLNISRYSKESSRHGSLTRKIKSYFSSRR
ncbi:putative lipid II flippase FtsW [Candidatus Peregrinibacteria bacterium]|jgi:cell division protein FtsW|nr:putative lipid II flippase FtsW [Candidatus Peregrinibacteria bacterium]